MPRKKNHKGASRALRQQRELRRLSKYFVYWRYHEDDDKSEVQTHRLLMDRNLLGVPMLDIEMELQALSLQFQCVTISYYQTPFGEKYRYFGYSQTKEPLRLAETDVSPLISIAKHAAEENRNDKQLYARAMVLLPSIQKSVDIFSVLQRLKTELSITDDDLQQLSDILNEEADVYDFEKTPNLDCDEKIRWFLEQQP
jgi:hypothetical protein